MRWITGLAIGGSLLCIATIGGLVAQTPTPDADDFQPPFKTPPRDYLKLPPPTDPAPSWAFTRDPPETADLKPRADDDVPRHLKGSTQTFTRRQAINHYAVVDWHPENHPPAPSVVMFGRRPQPTGCGFCHMPNGIGAPENAPLAGLPYNYFIQQIQDYLEKSRRTVDMRMASYHGMAEFMAPSMSKREMREAATYYSQLKMKPYLRVREVDMVPKTYSLHYTLMPVPGGGREPIGNRIIETPVDIDRFDLNDDENQYWVYVPRGSIERGKAIALKGNSAVPACASCHGADLKGIGDVPPIAGRGPSNLVRQLYNFKYDKRTSADAQLMIPVAKGLSEKDIVDVIAYAASRKP